MHLRVPLSVKRATRSAAHAQGLSVSEYVAACLSVSPVQDKPRLLARLSAWCVRWFTVVRF